MLAYDLARPLLFALRPAEAHEFALESLGVLEHVGFVRDAVRRACATRDPSLAVRTMGLEFPNPLGLAGGFDKNARRARALAALGFGFLELGTVTALAQEANPSPNLFRLPRDRALINRLGFPNQGAEAVAARIAAHVGGRGARLWPAHERVPIGVSIGKSRAVPVTPIEGVVADYVASFEAVRPVSDFVVVNVSSPNTKDLRAIQGPALARVLLAELVERRRAASDDVPLLVKVAPDSSDADLDALFDVVTEVGLEGVIATNTTVSRAGLRTDEVVVKDCGAGGLSGPPVHARALAVVARARARLGPDKTIIGVGGIESAKEARAMLDAGANLLQAYTGFVYGGPRFVERTLAGLRATTAHSSSS